MDYIGLEWIGLLDRVELLNFNRIFRMDRIGLSVGLGWGGSSSIGFVWIGLDWVGYGRHKKGRSAKSKERGSKKVEEGKVKFYSSVFNTI